MSGTYAYQGKATRIARARLTGVNASYKDLCEVCRSVRRKPTDYALEFLSQAARGEKAIRFARHNSGKGHRRELGGQSGGFPVKSVKFVLGVVESAFANANKLGLGETKIAHIIANKKATFPRMSPKGRRIRHDYETAFIEVVLEEIQDKVGDSKDAKKNVSVKKSGAVKTDSKKVDVKAAPVEAKKTPEAKPSEEKKSS